MRILYLNGAGYDYLTATLIEGLTELGHEVGSSCASNYGNLVAKSNIRAAAEAADLIIAGSNRGVDHHLLEGVTNPRVVAVDGSDHGTFEVSRINRVKAVFKRELSKALTNPEADYIFPLPFAAEKRYFAAPAEKDLLISFVANLETNPIRNSIHLRLLNRKHPAIFSGSSQERAYSLGAPRPNAIETPGYRRLLARSQISISAPGAGYDCARYWEILAARAMLFTYDPDIVIPNGFTDGINCATFSSISEFEDKLEYYLAHPTRVADIAAAGHAHLLKHHTTARRAAEFLELALLAVKRPGFCERFYTGEVTRNPVLARIIGKRNARRARSLVGFGVRACLRPFCRPNSKS